MHVEAAESATAAFPLPAGGGATAALRLHRFGSRPEHLAVDFTDRCQPRLVTEILVRCLTGADGSPPQREMLWDLEVGKRIEGLLRLAALDAGTGDSLEMQLRCEAPDCRAFLGFDLSIPELAAAASEPLPSVRYGGRELGLRRPTARDQLGWLERSFADEAEAIEAMATSLLEARPEEPLDRNLVAVVEEALAPADPLVRFSVVLDCPDCGHHQERAIDLAVLALRRLYRAQEGLLASVHRLAAHYHWSEAEILALPAWRRERYLALIDAEAGGGRWA